MNLKVNIANALRRTAAWLHAEPSIAPQWDEFPLLSEKEKGECLAAAHTHLTKLAGELNRLEAVERVACRRHAELMAGPQH